MALEFARHLGPAFTQHGFLYRAFGISYIFDGGNLTGGDGVGWSGVRMRYFCDDDFAIIHGEEEDLVAHAICMLFELDKSIGFGSMRCDSAEFDCVEVSVA